jgi:hypothetical protein
MPEIILSNKIPQEYVDQMRAAALEGKVAGVEPKIHLDAGEFRKDAAESFFVARQLEFMRPGIYAVQYPALKAQRLIPFNMGVDAGASQYTATVIDQTGVVRVSASMPDDVPMVELSTKQVSANIYNLTLGYQYSIQEAQAAMHAKVPLIPQKALRTREQMERKLDDIAFLGDTVSGIVGLLSLTGTDTYTVPANGAGNVTTWDKKASDDILADLNGAPNQVIVNTQDIEVPDTIVMPISSKTLIANRRVGDGTSMTILSYFLANQEYIKEVEATYKAETAASGNRRMVAYVKDPTRLEMVVSKPFTQLPPEARGFKVITLCHMRTAGLMAYLPKSIIYADHI